MHLSVGSPSPWTAAFPKSVAGFFLLFPVEISIKNARFGRALAQLILGALSLYPFEVKEGPGRRFLIDVPFGSFQAEGYISKGRGFLSDAPVGRFSDSLGRRLPRICGWHVPSVSS